MDDPERLPVLRGGLVRGVEPEQHVDDDGERHRLRNRAPRAGCQRADVRERLPGHVLHDQEEVALRGDDVDHRDDVRMVDPGDDPRLVDHHRDEVRVLRVLRVEPLDGDRPAEPGRGEHPPEVDRRHAARGDLVEDEVPPEVARHPASVQDAPPRYHRTGAVHRAAGESSPCPDAPHLRETRWNARVARTVREGCACDARPRAVSPPVSPRARSYLGRAPRVWRAGGAFGRPRRARGRRARAAGRGGAAQ